MTATLEEAIAAVKRGETERAQLLTAEFIRDNPDDANAWYLLSQLVDSDTRRTAYLNKALALDPAHERARAELGALAIGSAPQPEPMAVFEPVMSDTAPDIVPEWLQPLSPEAAPTAETVAPPIYEATPPQPAPAQPALTPSRPQPTPPPPPPPRQQGNGALTALLVLLGLLTLAVLAILAYLLLF
jgi:ferric-dicitrate binding protein FerR (iron transport regulator)